MNAIRNVTAVFALAAAWSGNALAWDQKTQQTRIVTLIQDMNRQLDLADKELRDLEGTLVAQKVAPSKSSEQARRAQCTNNLKQISLGMHDKAKSLQGELAQHKSGKSASDSAAQLARIWYQIEMVVVRTIKAGAESKGEGLRDAVIDVRRELKTARAKTKTLEIQMKDVLISN